MPTLVLLRHAKSAWPRGVDDHERALTGRGERDAASAGSWLTAHIGAPDLVVMSTARRTQQTWAGAAGTSAALAGAPTHLDQQVYAASVDTLLSVVQAIPEGVQSALLIGHCPGVEELTHLLVGTATPAAANLLAVKYPTCGIAVLELPGPWRTTAPGVAHLADFAVPRAG